MLAFFYCIKLKTEEIKMYSKFKTINNKKISLLSFCLVIVLFLPTVGCSKVDKQGNSGNGDNVFGDANQNIDIGEKDLS